MRLITLTIIMFGIMSNAMASEIKIDMKKIWKIESGGNALAYNRHSGARGLYQITTTCLMDYNKYHKNKYSKQDLFNPEINAIVANWYINKRIPEMLKHFKRPDTVDNRLISYNCGISCVIKGHIPRETRDYIDKYRR